MQLNLPVLFNEYPTKGYIKSAFPHVQNVGVIKKIALRVYVRTRLAEAQNWRCCWCGVHCVPEPGRGNSVTLEHVTPRSKGGTDEKENLAMACRNCNSRRGDEEADVFYQQRPWAKITNSMNKLERRQHGRMRENIRRAKIFKLNGWRTAKGEPVDVDNWIATLSLHPDSVKILKLEIGA